jgi:hypothetical protein
MIDRHASSTPLAPKRGYGRFDLGIAINGRCDRLHSERSGGGLE